MSIFFGNFLEIFWIFSKFLNFFLWFFLKFFWNFFYFKIIPFFFHDGVFFHAVFLAPAQGRCSRDNPPCKYYHPPQHLKDQLLVNGRNHLAMKNILVQQMQMQAVTLPPQLQLQPATQMQSLMNSYYTQAAAANAFNAGNPYLNAAQLYTTSSSPGPSGSGMSGLGESSSSSSPMASYASAGMFQQQHGGAMSSGGGGGGGGGSNNNKSRMDRLEVCREFARRNCRRSETDCRYAHPSEHVQVKIFHFFPLFSLFFHFFLHISCVRLCQEKGRFVLFLTFFLPLQVTDNMVVVCMDSLKGTTCTSCFCLGKYSYEMRFFFVIVGKCGRETCR